MISLLFDDTRCLMQCSAPPVQINLSLMDGGKSNKIVRLCNSHAYNSVDRIRPPNIREISLEELTKLQFEVRPSHLTTIGQARLDGYLIIDAKNQFGDVHIRETWQAECSKEKRPDVIVMVAVSRPPLTSSVQWMSRKMYRTDRSMAVQHTMSKLTVEELDHVARLYSDLCRQYKFSPSTIKTDNYTGRLRSPDMLHEKALEFARSVIELELMMADDNLFVCSQVQLT